MILAVEDLCKQFERDGLPLKWSRARRPGEGAVAAVDHVSFTLEKAETLGLVGESGSGKTTLARCILRLEKATSGRILFRGGDFLSLSGRALRRERRYLQAVFQDPFSSLNPKMRVGQILSESLAVHGLGAPAERREKAAMLLHEVGLDASAARRYPSEFSGGQRQRIAIARAISVEPELILADEPVSALDVSVQLQILQLLRRLKERRGLALLFITHSLPVVRQISDRVAVMYRGRIVETGPVEALFSQPAHPYTKMLIESSPEPDPSRRKPLPSMAEECPRGTWTQVGDGHWAERL